MFYTSGEDDSIDYDYQYELPQKFSKAEASIEPRDTSKNKILYRE